MLLTLLLLLLLLPPHHHHLHHHPQRRTCFDSAEFFMAKEAGLAPLPLYQPRTEPTCMLRKPSQPSRLSIGAD
jgi:hypothetical protein